MNPTPISYGRVFDGKFPNLLVAGVNQNAQILQAPASVVAGKPSNKLLDTTNTTLGYASGCIMAQASGKKTDQSSSGFVAGGWSNWNPSSLDTGLAAPTKLYVLFNPANLSPANNIFPANTAIPSISTNGVNFDALSTSVQCLMGGGKCFIQYYMNMYGPTDPVTDATIVQTLLNSLQSSTALQQNVVAGTQFIQISF